MKQLVRTGPAGPAAGAITEHFVFVNASALDPETMRRVPEAETLEDEVRVCVERLTEALEQAGLTTKDLAKVTCWVSEEQYRFPFITAYRDLLYPGPYPSRGLFVHGLLGDARIQIEAVAARRTEA